MQQSRVFIVDVTEKDLQNHQLVIEINEMESDLQLSLEFVTYEKCLKQVYLTANCKTSVHFNFLDCSCVMNFEEFKILICTFYPEWTI